MDRYQIAAMVVMPVAAGLFINSECGGGVGQAAATIAMMFVLYLAFFAFGYIFHDEIDGVIEWFMQW